MQSEAERDGATGAGGRTSPIPNYAWGAHGGALHRGSAVRRTGSGETITPLRPADGQLMFDFDIERGSRAVAAALVGPGGVALRSCVRRTSE